MDQLLIRIQLYDGDPSRYPAAIHVASNPSRRDSFEVLAADYVCVSLKPKPATSVSADVLAVRGR